MTATPTARAHRTSPRSRRCVARPAVGVARDPHGALGRGCRPRGCRAPARRIHGRRVRYHIGNEPGQINGRRWRGRGAAPRTGRTAG
ncbi:tryptophan biosynthesis modulator TrpM [Streptomyces sp. NPDC059740]|uniref:tryptophan biosynthesis modulator TrpM n=1 Tax=Streptomyces sp. NPDC059740 TaxID=3346926 RepID=UPI003647050D